MSVPFTPQEIEDIREAFGYYDRDRDGFISVQDLGTVMRSLGQTPSDNDVQNLISQLNQSNGLINFEQLVAIMEENKKNTSTEEQIMDAFKVFDKEGKGLIPTQELKHVLTSLGEKLSDQEAEDMISEADRDNSGFIDYSAFVSMLLGK
ncbi:calcium ion binding, calmodulin [Neoconidiobolus thromboides FSU 785]|nr:calcium ion binding, calmodulin [Neoconidiobolus thromboides FSU 785]